MDECTVITSNVRQCLQGGMNTPARARKAYLVPGIRSVAVTADVLLLRWMECQAGSLCARISISHRQPFGSCAHMPTNYVGFLAILEHLSLGHA